MIVLGIDIALSNTGLVKAQLNLENYDIKVISMHLSETKPGGKKRVRKNSEDLERCRIISQDLEDALDEADLIFVEMPVGSQSARAMASYGMSIGILSNIDIPMIQVTPSEVKLAGAGKNASKKEMIDWGERNFPDAPFFRSKSGNLLNKNEHLCDALAAIVAGTKTDDFKTLANMIKNMPYNFD